MSNMRNRGLSPINPINEYRSLGSILALVASIAAMALTPVNAADRGEGRFHLVYLVSTDKVEPGAKAYVEPLVFTDGKSVIGVWSYCADLFKESYCKSNSEDRFCKGVSQKAGPVLQTSQIIEDIRPIHSYCSNQPVTLSGEKYYVLRNDGTRIQVDNIDFRVTPDTESLVGSRDFYPPSLALVGTTKISKVMVEPVVKQVSTSTDIDLQYFFLMTSDEVFLQRVVPVKQRSRDGIQKLVEQSQTYAEKVKGQLRTKDRVSDRSALFKGVKPRLIAPIFADLDRDGAIDVIAGMQAGPAKSMNNPRMPLHWYWAGTAVLLAKGDPVLFSGLYQSDSFRGLLTSGYVMNAPLGLVDLNNCHYLISSLREGVQVPMTFDFISMPEETASCKDLAILRQLEDPENINPPR